MSSPRPAGHVEAWEERAYAVRGNELADEWQRRLALINQLRDRGLLSHADWRQEMAELRIEMMARLQRHQSDGPAPIVPDFADIAI